MNKFKKISICLCCVALTLGFTGCEIASKETQADNTTASNTTATTATTTATTTTTTTTTTTVTTTTYKTAASSYATKKSSTSATVKVYPYAYAGFNPQPTDMNVPFNLVLLNRDYCLPDGYVPNLLPAISGSNIMLHHKVAPYYQKMYNAALVDGIKLTPISGYRSFARQKRNFEMEISNNMKAGMSKEIATQKAAEIRLLPGTSEHNAGLAMDICSLSTKFDKTKEFKWLQQHAHEYGFILRYPKDKTHITNITYEPWHYRYVGVDAALEIKNSGMVLEEYLGKA